VSEEDYEVASFPGLDRDETNFDSVPETIDCTPDVNGNENVVERLTAVESTRPDQKATRGSISQFSVERDESVVREPAVGLKKKVGRPRRNDEGVQRKRGRPPKSSLIRENYGTSLPNDKPVKKKWGRPPKSSVKQIRPEASSQKGDMAKRERDRPELPEENKKLDLPPKNDEVVNVVGGPLTNRLPAKEEEGLRSPRESTSPERPFSRAGTHQTFHRAVLN
jgi:hypothetical protein